MINCIEDIHKFLIDLDNIYKIVNCLPEFNNLKRNCNIEKVNSLNNIKFNKCEVINERTKYES